jgi:hypothetical protein
MTFEVLEPLYTISLDVFPQLAWTLFVIGGLTIYLIIRAVLETIT